jgi:hypothetical protein
MHRKGIAMCTARRLRAALVTAVLALGPTCFGSPAWPQAVTPTPATAESAPDLREMVARIALYPDDVLSLMLPASTAALDVVEAVRYLGKRAKDPSLAPDAGWDPSVIALLNYPQALRLMDSDLDWTNRLGQAVTDDLDGVFASIQTIRSEAADAGYLASNAQVVVTRQPAPGAEGTGAAGQPIVINSTDPDIAYVPSYDPATVVNQAYVSAPPVAYANPYLSYHSPAAPFFTGLLFGTAIGYGLDWDDDDIDIDIRDVDFDDIDWDRVDWDKAGRLRGDLNVNGDANINNIVNNGILKNVDRDTFKSRIDANRGAFRAAHERIGNSERRAWRPENRPADPRNLAGDRARQRVQGLAPTRGLAAEDRPRRADPAGTGQRRLQQRVGDGQHRRGGAFGGVQPQRETGRASARGRESLDLPRRPAVTPQRDRPAQRQMNARPPQQASSVRQGVGGSRPFGNVSNGNRSRAESARGQRGGGRQRSR